MAITVGSMLDRQSQTIQELIGRTAVEIGINVSGFFDEFVLSDADVIGDNILGRDMVWKKKFYGSLAGVIEGGKKTSHFGLYGDITDAQGVKFARQTLTQAFPDATQSVHPIPYGLQGGLYSLTFNLMITLGTLQLQATPANIKEHVRPLFMGLAKNIGHFIDNAWNLDGSDQFALAGLGPNTGTGAYTLQSSANTITFFPTNQITRRFEVGQEVDLFVSTTRVNEASNVRIAVRVQSVDDWNNKVILVTDDVDVAGSSFTWTNVFTTTTLGNGTCNVVAANTDDDGAGAFEGIYGWRRWIVPGDDAQAVDHASNVLLGSDAQGSLNNGKISVLQHPEFRSGKFTSIGDLDETTLLSILERAESALGRRGMMTDRLVAAEGIWLDVFDSLQPRSMFNRGNAEPGAIRQLGMKGPFEIVSSEHTYMGTTDRKLPDGEIVSLKTRGNWSIVAPNDPQGTQRGAMDAHGGRGFSKIPALFVVPALSGNSSIRALMYTSNGQQLTEGSQMPGYVRMNLIPKDQIPGFILTGVNSTRRYAG